MGRLDLSNTSRCMQSRSESRSSPLPEKEMILDRINALLSQEKSMAYSVRNYLQDQYMSVVAEPVNDTCRLKMVDWLYAIVDVCQLRREAVPIAMSYVDRLLSNHQGDYTNKVLESRDRYQFVVITCLYIAVKLHEEQVISPALLSRLSQGRYSEHDIEKEESFILSALGWFVNGPSTIDFVEHFLALATTSNVDQSAVASISLISRMQAELSVADQSLVSVPYSTIALASIRNAMEEIGLYSPRDWYQSLQKISTLVDNVDPFSIEVDEVSARLKQMVKESASGTLLPRLSSELVCHKSKQLPKPILKREISSPTSVSRLSVTNLNVVSPEQ